MAEQNTTPFIIDVEPIGRRIEGAAGETILSAIQKAGIEIAAVCGGAHICGKCIIKPISGEFSEVSAVETEKLGRRQIAAGFRLACSVLLAGAVKIYVPAETLTASQRLQLEGKLATFEADPPLMALDIAIDPPSLQDLRSDATRLLDALSNIGVQDCTISLAALKNLPRRLRSQNGSARVVVVNGEKVIATLPLRTSIAGVAVDIGTTKLAAYLVDLESAAILAKTGAVNPQVAYGDDVVNRIAFSNKHPDGVKTLHRKLIAQVNQMIGELCKEAAFTKEQILDAVVVGNTAMHHFFADLPVQQLGEAPYLPAVSHSLTFSAAELGLDIASGAAVHLPPNIAGYVGADHVAMLLSTRIWENPFPTIAIDLGTNSEVSLATGGRVFSCSCASGPAFEGAHIEQGMRAIPGAIERVQIQGDAVLTQTIAARKAIGICGSGILDAVAELYRAGIINAHGRFSKNHPALTTTPHGETFVLVPAEASGSGRAIMVSRKDITEIQLAKAAVRTGIDTLLMEAGIEAGDIGMFVIAGAFGSYIDINSAMTIGMFPRLPEERFQQVGNAAGMGAVNMLLSARARREAKQIPERISYIELTTHPRFFDIYTRSLAFDSRSEGVVE